MPVQLENCVEGLIDRGVAESSAYAICTASLQRDGFMYDTSEQKLSLYNTFKSFCSIEPVFFDRIQNSFTTMSPDEIHLVTKIRRIYKTEIKGIFGSAILGSKEININPDVLDSLGEHPLWMGSTLIHEAQHAVKGFDENDATHADQRYTGRLYALAEMYLDRDTIYNSLRSASISQSQREVEVDYSLRRNDFNFLISVGYSAKSSRGILNSAKRASKKLKIDKKIIDKQMRYNNQFITQEALEIIDPIVFKTTTDALSTMIRYRLDNIVLKSESTGLQPADKISYDFYVALGRKSDFYSKEDEKFILDVVFEHKYRFNDEMQTFAKDRINFWVEKAAEKGLWDNSGVMTPEHAMLCIYGFNEQQKPARTN